MRSRRRTSARGQTRVSALELLDAPAEYADLGVGLVALEAECGHHAPVRHHRLLLGAHHRRGAAGTIAATWPVGPAASRADPGVLHHRLAAGRGCGTGTRRRRRCRAVSTYRKPETSAADRVTVLEHVRLDAMLLEVHAVRRREIFEDIATTAPVNPGVVTRLFHRVVCADGTVHRSPDLDLGRGQVK